jgi:hypothetical protein
VAASGDTRARLAQRETLLKGSHAACSLELLRSRAAIKLLCILRLKTSRLQLL